MNLVATMPVKNEEWVVGLSLRVALKWNDAVVVLLHDCTDQSAAIVAEVSSENPDRVLTLVDNSNTWDEMPQRNRMLEWARHNAGELGATHVSICDCDELLTGNLVGNIREYVARLNTGQMLMLPGYNLRGGLNRYHLNGVWGQRWFSTAFKDVNTAAWKGDKHHRREPEGVEWNYMKPVRQGDGGIVHLWGASERRLIAKHALAKVRDTLRWPDKLADHERTYSLAIKGGTAAPYSHFGTPATWTYAATPDNWWFGYKEWMQYLDIDAVPWQERAVRDLVAEHGRERFQGLDLFGLV
jgi:hypothetical protein